MQIFLSHASVDTRLVEQVKTALEPLAIVYCTEDDNRAGENVHTKIQAQIRKSDIVIVLLSERGAESVYLHQEIGFAKSAEKLVIPVVARGVTGKDLGMLEGIEYIQLDDGTHWLSRLSSRVESVVGRSDVDARSENGTAEVALAAIVVAAILWASRV